LTSSIARGGDSAARKNHKSLIRGTVPTSGRLSGQRFMHRWKCRQWHWPSVWYLRALVIPEFPSLDEGIGNSEGLGLSMTFPPIRSISSHPRPWIRRVRNDAIISFARLVSYLKHSLLERRFPLACFNGNDMKKASKRRSVSLDCQTNRPRLQTLKSMP
jgi:hypothetical protein